MDFMLALNVTIYGLGIVFLALLVLMFTIMVLGRLLSAATGKDLMVAPGVAAQPPSPPPSAGTAQPPAASPQASAVSQTFKLLVGGDEHVVELRESGPAATSVTVGGTTFRVERDPADPTRLLVNGHPHAIELQGRGADSAEVVVDGARETVRMLRRYPPTPAVQVAAPAVPAAAPPAAEPRPAPAPAAGESVTAPLPGKVLSVAVKPGDTVKKGDELCVIEAMKMGNSIRAQRDGTIVEVLVSAGDSVSFGSPLLSLG